ncbi:glutamate--cysteine ligase [Leuconostocaceae bacterium ESL0723]|nr:glutamate--cysteine ligase [Leuconostocaceae bacterium ESL0723]
MSTIVNELVNQKHLAWLYQGHFGIEIEEHRVQTGRKSLSQHPHPASLGDRIDQPYFQTDFSESMEELVTAPKPSTKAVLDHLHELQAILAHELQPDEIIWPLSMPPHLAPDDLKFLETHFERYWYQDYRDTLARRYGYFQHIMTGIHVNFSFDTDFLDWFQENRDLPTRAAAENQLYFKVAQQLVGYRWLLTYLLGASPVSENAADHLNEKAPGLQPVRSWRESKYGFANLPGIKNDYTSMANLIKQVDAYLASGDLFDKSEFYGPVRFKGPQTLDDIKSQGTDYVEFRMFDLNPFSQDGITKAALDLVHLLVLDAVTNDHEWTGAELDAANDLNNRVALAHPTTPLEPSAQRNAADTLKRLAHLAQQAPAEWRDDLLAAVAQAQAGVIDPRQTVGGHLVHEFHKGSLAAFAMQRGRILQDERLAEPAPYVFATGPLLPNYIQAQKMGFKTEVKPNNHLSLDFRGHHWDADANTNLDALRAEVKPGDH